MPEPQATIEWPIAYMYMYRHYRQTGHYKQATLIIIIIIWVLQSFYCYIIIIFLFPDIPRIPLLDRKELFNAIFDITAYCPPSSIVLPMNYTPPKLAISKLYWKGWILLLVLSAFNPTTIG